VTARYERVVWVVPGRLQAATEVPLGRFGGRLFENNFGSSLGVGARIVIAGAIERGCVRIGAVAWNFDTDGTVSRIAPSNPRKSIRWSSPRRLLPGRGRQALSVALVAIEHCAVLAVFGTPLTSGLAQNGLSIPFHFYPSQTDPQSLLTPAVTYTVTFTCTNGNIYLAVRGDPSLCADGTGSAGFEPGSAQLGQSPDSGYEFSAWSASGSVSISGSGLMTVSGSGGVTATFTSCPAPSVGTPTPKVQLGYRQAWVNWSYTHGSTSFSWSADNVSLPTPQLSGGSGSASINLNDLTAGTTYAYTATVEGTCGNEVQKGGSFSTNSSMLTIDGSNVTFQSGPKSLSTNLTTSLSHDLVVAEFASVEGTGDVSTCFDSQHLLTFTQRAEYTPASGSPWIFDWDAQASGPFTHDEITCTYTVSGGGGSHCLWNRERLRCLPL
jgi:hypothetical protein